MANPIFHEFYLEFENRSIVCEFMAYIYADIQVRYIYFLRNTMANPIFHQFNLEFENRSIDCEFVDYISRRDIFFLMRYHCQSLSDENQSFSLSLPVRVYESDSIEKPN